MPGEKNFKRLCPCYADEYFASPRLGSSPPSAKRRGQNPLASTGRAPCSFFGVGVAQSRKLSHLCPALEGSNGRLKKSRKKIEKSLLGQKKALPLQPLLKKACTAASEFTRKTLAEKKSAPTISSKARKKPNIFLARIAKGSYLCSPAKSSGAKTLKSARRASGARDSGRGSAQAGATAKSRRRRRAGPKSSLTLLHRR